jgi:arylsulfatase A-like enzyme
MFTLDQFRADCLSCARHPVVRTPNLDALAASGVRFANHHGQAAPCAPGRASLYTGTYQMNHRVVGNGTPLDRRLDNIALLARRAGYRPALFGYTDQAIDPRDADGPDDPRLSTYNGVLPGFDDVVHVPDDHAPWIEWLATLGHDVSAGPLGLLATEHTRPEEHSVGAFVTDAAIGWISDRVADGEPWFAHVSHLRPHPPYSAAGRWATAYHPADVGTPITPVAEPHWFHRAVLGMEQPAAPTDPDELAHLRAQYFGMVSHIDHQVGRLVDTLDRLGVADDTIVVVTADHGEMLGDHGLKEKLGYWEESYAIPCIVRIPSRVPGRVEGVVVDQFTEAVDVMPTIAELLGQPVPAQCDGYPLTGFLTGEQPPRWRTSTHWEYDWRSLMITAVAHRWPWDRALEEQHLTVTRTATHAYVQFGNGDWLCFDLAADPTWRTTTDDPAVVLPLAQEMLTWRSRHTDRTLADLVLVDGGVGRFPPLPWVG